MSGPKFAWFIAFCMFLTCAGVEEEIVEEVTTVGTKIVVENQNPEWLVDVNLPVKVKEYRIPQHSTLKTGTFFTGYHPIGENLLVVDRYSSSINCINNTGGVEWELKPPSPGLDKYDNIGGIDADYASNEIYIEDRPQVKIDVFSFDGAYLRSITPPSPFMDFAVLGPNRLVYDVAQTSWGAFPEEIHLVKRYLFQDDHGFTLNSPISLDFDLKAVPFNGFNRFSRVDGALLHRMPFEDLSYLIKNENANPVLEISFKVNSQFKEVGLNKLIDNKAVFLFENEIPYPSEVVSFENTGKTFVIYARGRERFLICDDNGKQIINPGNYYNFDGHILPSPRSYESGKFFLQIYKYQYDFLQESYRKGELVKENVDVELDKLSGEFGDNDDILIFSLEFDSE